jgi:hypothetical protein
MSEQWEQVEENEEERAIEHITKGENGFPSFLQFARFLPFSLTARDARWRRLLRSTHARRQYNRAQTTKERYTKIDTIYAFLRDQRPKKVRQWP